MVICTSFFLSVLDTAWTVPFPFGFCSKVNTSEMKPLYWTIRVITTNHLPVGHLMAETIRGLVGVDGHVQHIGRMDG